MTQNKNMELVEHYYRTHNKQHEFYKDHKGEMRPFIKHPYPNTETLNLHEAHHPYWSKK